MKKRIIVLAAAVVVSAGLAAGAECPTGEGAGLSLPLYAWSGEGAYVPANAPQVGTVVLHRLQTGELVARVRLDDGEPCMTFSVYSSINGDWHSEDVAQMTTNLERMGETCVSLPLANYAPGADTINFQTIIKPSKSPARVAYATLNTRIVLSQMAVVPAEPSHRPPPRQPAPDYPAYPPQMPCYPPQPPPCQPQVVPCQPLCDPCAPCSMCGPYWQGHGFVGPGRGPYGPQQPPGQQVVVAQEFRLVDAQGSNRGALRTNAYGMPELTLWDQQEQPRAVLALQGDGSPQLDLMGQNGRSRLAMTVLADGSLSLAMVDARGEYRALIGLGTDGSPSLQLIDDGRRVRAAVDLATTGSPEITLMDQNAQPRASLRLSDDGKPNLTLSDARGRAVFDKP